MQQLCLFPFLCTTLSSFETSPASCACCLLCSLPDCDPPPPLHECLRMQALQSKYCRKLLLLTFCVINSTVCTVFFMTALLLCHTPVEQGAQMFPCFFSRGSHLPLPQTALHINVPFSGICCLHLYGHWRNPVSSGPLLYPT